MRHNDRPVDDALQGLDESLLQDLDTVKLIPPDDPKLLAAKRLLNEADAAIQRSEQVRAKPKIFDENWLNRGGKMYLRKQHAETPVERIFRRVTGRRMNRMEKRYFLRKRRSIRKAN